MLGGVAAGCGKKLCTRGSNRALLGGPSTSPLRTSPFSQLLFDFWFSALLARAVRTDCVTLIGHW
jgi:hypothetical protein